VTFRIEPGISVTELPHIYWPKVVGWSATAICAVGSSRSASAFAKHAHQGRVFTILALFSLSWALFIPYYSECSPSELLNGFSGFLLVYIGVLLGREAGLPSTVLDRVALFFYAGLIAPSFLILFAPQNQANIPIIFKLSNSTPVISTIILIIGFRSIAVAIGSYSSSKRASGVLSVVLFIYALTEGVFTFKQVMGTMPAPNEITECLNTNFFWIGPPRTSPLNAIFLSLFSGLKMVFSGLFICLVLKERLSFEDRCLSVPKKLMKFFGVPATLGNEEVPCIEKALVSRSIKERQEALKALEQIDSLEAKQALARFEAGAIDPKL
jgi:hypothetical protein